MKAHPLWTCKQTLKIGKTKIPVALPAGGNYIRVNSPIRKILYPILIKPFRLRNRALVDGFIEKNIGKWLRQYSKESDLILDVGCGDMRLYKYVLPETFYYAFDISINELFLKEKVKDKNRNLHFAIASATSIPLKSNTADIVACIEVLDHITEYETVIKEIFRVTKPKGLAFISISNNLGYEYKTRPHPEHHNAWSYEEFRNIMERNRFDLLEGFMTGKWVRLPLWLTKTAYHLPLSSESEFYNTNFLYAFRVNKA